MRKVHDGRTRAPKTIKEGVQMITTGKFSLVTNQGALLGIINQDFAKVNEHKGKVTTFKLNNNCSYSQTGYCRMTLMKESFFSSSFAIIMSKKFEGRHTIIKGSVISKELEQFHL